MCVKNPQSRKGTVRRGLLFALCCLRFAPLGAAIAAPPQLLHLYPAGIQAGQSASVTAGGTFANWPVQAWCSRSDVTLTPETEKGKLILQAAEGAPPGIAWLRLHDDEGASAARPFVIGALPEVNEQEPNDDPLKPHKLPEGAMTVNGRLAKNGDVDTFAFSLSKGQTLVASCLAHSTLGSPMDGVLQIVSSNGFVLAQNNDEHGLDPLLAFAAPRDGVYLVRLFALPAVPSSAINLAGGETFIYRLTITSGCFVEYTWPLALSSEQDNSVRLCGWNLPDPAVQLTLKPAAGVRSLVVHQADCAGAVELPVVNYPSIVESRGAGDAAQLLPVPATVTGRIERPGETDVYSIKAAKGEKLSIRIAARGVGLPLDPTLKVIDSAGKPLAQADDTRDSRDAELSWAAPADGTFSIAVRDLYRQGGPRYAYRLTVEPQRPDFTLRVAAETYLLIPGKPLEIPITIEASGGFNQPLEISAMGLPEGVEAKPVAAAKGAKQVKLALTATSGPAQGPFRIIGAPAEQAEQAKTAAFALPAFGSAMEDLWLTIQKPK